MSSAQYLIEQLRQERHGAGSMERTSLRALSSALGESGAAELMGAPVGKAIRSLSQAIDSSAPTPGGEPAYHNILHFKEAVMAMASLTAGEFKGADQARMVGLGVLAMVGHDFQHDGSTNAPGRPISLEQISWEACKPHLESARMGRSDMALVESIILGTDPVLLVANRQRYQGLAEPTALGRQADQLRMLANEADIAGSLLPGVGHALGDLLAAEWNKSGIEMGQTVATWPARLGFLKFAATATAGSKLSGLESARVSQVAAFDRIALDLGLSDGAQASRKLGEIASTQGKDKALEVFAKALANVDPALAACAYPYQAPASQLDFGKKLTAFRGDRECAKPEITKPKTLG